MTNKVELDEKELEKVSGGYEVFDTAEQALKDGQEKYPKGTTVVIPVSMFGSVKSYKRATVEDYKTSKYSNGYIVMFLVKTEDGKTQWVSEDVFNY